MHRTFQHAGRRWEAVGLGTGVSGRYERMHWLVEFNCLSDPDQRKLSGFIAKADPNSVTEDRLVAALEEALILDVLDRADKPPTAAEIASASGLEEDAVVRRIAQAADSVIEVFPPTTPARYRRR